MLDVFIHSQRRARRWPPAGRKRRALGLELLNELLESLRVVAVALGPAGREESEVITRVAPRHSAEGGLDALIALRDLCGAAASIEQVRREHRVVVRESVFVYERGREIVFVRERE